MVGDARGHPLVVEGHDGRLTQERGGLGPAALINGNAGLLGNGQRPAGLQLAVKRFGAKDGADHEGEKDQRHAQPPTPQPHPPTDGLLVIVQLIAGQLGRWGWAIFGRRGHWKVASGK